jgi:hypothetical protein
LFCSNGSCKTDPPCQNKGPDHSVSWFLSPVAESSTFHTRKARPFLFTNWLGYYSSEQR